MTGLLVSVRDAAEAQVALSSGVDLLDIKEPRAGSLGPADVAAWQRIAAVNNATVPLSVALGELQSDAVSDLARQAFGMQFAKIGLAGCGNLSDWQVHWRDAIDALPHEVASVAVIYADHAIACSPLPSLIIDYAIKFGCAAILFDTFSKVNGHLFDHLTESELSRLVELARQSNLKVVLGGSLRDDLIHRALELEPDYIAVRGAVCNGARHDSVDRDRIKALSDTIRASRSPSC